VCLFDTKKLSLCEYILHEEKKKYVRMLGILEGAAVRGNHKRVEIAVPSAPSFLRPEREIILAEAARERKREERMRRSPFIYWLYCCLLLLVSQQWQAGQEASFNIKK